MSSPIGVEHLATLMDRTTVVPPDQGYSSDPDHALYGKTLYFELTLEDIDRP